MLAKALDLAAGGCPVFPCSATTKAPRLAGGFRAASTDPAAIRAMDWSEPCLIGVPTGPRDQGGCGLDVLDIDAAAGGDVWWADNAARIPATLIQETRRAGGKHVWFVSRPGTPCSAGRIAPGVDVRAAGGYVVHWQSAGRPVWLDFDPAPWPAWLAEQAGRRPVAADPADPATAERLTPPSAAAVVELLNRMHNGADVTRDAYVSVMHAAAGCARLVGDDDGAIQDAAVSWAARYSGDYEAEESKWLDDWSHRPAATAWPQLQGHAVRLIPEYQAEQAAAEFDALPPAAPAAPRPRFTFGAAYVPRDPASIPPREWLYGGHYIRQFITATVAPGGVGKSSLALVEALDMATGRGLLTGKPTGQRHRVIYWNGEDPLIETERRVAAACLHFGITADELGDRLVICSGRDLPIRIAEDTRDGFAIARPLVEEITADLIRSGADALILDPFVKSHGVSENDNNKIDAVASQWAAIADRANVSIELIHHLRKASGTGQDRGAEDARGGVALIAAARSVRVLNRMQDQEAVALGIPDETRRRCFRVDDGKANLQPPRGTGDQAIWRYLASVPLGNGQAGLAADHVGVVTAWVKPAIGDNVTAEHVAEITRRLRAGEPNRRDPRSPDWAGKWIAGVLGVDLAGAGATKRVGKMLDVMVSQGRLGVGSEMDERRRPRATFAPVAPVLQSAENEPEQTGATGAVPGPHPCSTPVDRGCGGLERAKTVAAPVGEVERGKRRPGAADLAAMLAEGRA